MLKNNLTKTIFIIGILALFLALSPVAFAAEKTPLNAEKADKNVEESKDKQTKEKRKEILKEATTAIQETQKALNLLSENKNKEAIAALERATGKLEIILARDPSLILAPYSVDSVTYDIMSTPGTIKSLIKEAEDALKDGRVQQARLMIRNLASETVISVSNIPLGTYPDAIKLAAKNIDEDKVEEAKTVLQNALNTTVIKNTIIPLPIVGAKYLLGEAEKLAEKTDRSEDENKLLTGYLEDARIKVEFAQVLGYGSKENLKNLNDQLDDIEEKTTGGKFGTGFFKKIKGYLNDTVKSSQQDNSASKKE